MSANNIAKQFIRGTANFIETLDCYKGCSVNITSRFASNGISCLGTEVIYMDITLLRVTIDKYMFWFGDSGDIDEIWVYGINKSDIVRSITRRGDRTGQRGQLWGLGIETITKEWDHYELKVSDCSICYD